MEIDLEIHFGNLHDKLNRIINTQEKIMAAIDDLQAADAAETAELATVAQALTDEITRVNAALAALPVNNDPAIAAVAADLQTHTTNLQTIATALAAVAAAQPPVAGS